MSGPIPSGHAATRTPQLQLKQQRLTMPPASAPSRAADLSDLSSSRPTGNRALQGRGSTGSALKRSAYRDVEVIDLTAASDGESGIMIVEPVRKAPNQPTALQSRPRLSKRSLLQADGKDALLDTGGLPLRRDSGTIHRGHRNGDQRSVNVTPSQHASQGSQSSSARHASLLLKSPTASPGTNHIGTGGILHSSSFAMSRQSSSTSVGSQSGFDLGRRRLLQTSSGSGNAISTPTHRPEARSPVKHAAFSNPPAASGSTGKRLAASVLDRRATRSPRSVLARLLSNSPTKPPVANGSTASAKPVPATAQTASTGQPGSEERHVIIVTSGSEDERGFGPLGQSRPQGPGAAIPRRQNTKISPLKRDRPASLLSGSGVAREGSDTPKKARFGILRPTASNPFLASRAGDMTQPGSLSSSKQPTSRAHEVVAPDGGVAPTPCQGTSQTRDFAGPVPPDVEVPSEGPAPPSSSPAKRPRPVVDSPEDPPSSVPKPSQSSTGSGLTSRTATTETQASESGRTKRVRPSAGAYTIPEFDAPDDEWRDRAGRSIPLTKHKKKRTTTGSSSQASAVSWTLIPGRANGASSPSGPAVSSQQTPKAAPQGSQSTQEAPDRRGTPTPKAVKLAPASATKARAGESAASPLKRVASIMNSLRTPNKASSQAASDIGSPLTPLPKGYEESVVLSVQSPRPLKSTSIESGADGSTQPGTEERRAAGEEEEDLLLAFADFEYTVDETGNLSETPPKASQRSLPGSTRKSAPLSPTASLASLSSRRAALSPTQTRLPLTPSRTANSLSPTILKRQLLRATPNKSPVTATAQPPTPRDMYAELTARREEERKQQAEIDRLAEERREQWQRALASAAAEVDDVEDAREFMQKLATKQPDTSRRSARISGTSEAESPPNRPAPATVRDPKTSEFDKFIRAEERKDKKGISDERIAQAIRDAAAATKALKVDTNIGGGYPTPEATASPRRPSNEKEADAEHLGDISNSLEIGIERVDLARVRAILEKGVEGDDPDARKADLTVLDEQLLKDAKRELERRKQAKIKPQRGGRPKVQWTGFWATPNEDTREPQASGDKALSDDLPLSTWLKLTRGHFEEDLISQLPEGLIPGDDYGHLSVATHRALLSAAVTLPLPQCEMALCALENHQLQDVRDPFDEDFLDLVLLLLARLGARQVLLPERKSVRQPVHPTLAGPDIHRQRNAACIAIARLLTTAERDGGFDTDVAEGLIPVLLLLAVDPTTTDDSFRAISDAIHALWPSCAAGKTAVGAAMELVALVRNESIHLQHAVFSTIGTRSAKAREASRWTAIALLVPGWLESLTLDQEHTVPPPDLLIRGAERIFEMMRSKSSAPDPITLGHYLDFLYASMTDWDALVKLCVADANDNGSEFVQGLPAELAAVRSAVAYASRALKIDMDSDAQTFRNKTRLDQLQRVIGLRGAEAAKRLRRATRPSLGQSLREGEGGQTKLAFGHK